MRLRACQRLSRGQSSTFFSLEVTTAFRNNDLSGPITWELHLCFVADPTGTWLSQSISPQDKMYINTLLKVMKRWKLAPLTPRGESSSLSDTGPSTSSEHKEHMKQATSHFRSTPTGVAAEELQSLLPTQTSWRCSCPSYPAQGEPRSQWLLQITQHSRRAALPFLDSSGSSGQAGPAEESSVKPLLQKFACALGDLANGVPSSLQLSKLLVKW